jgi:hypothetical protein
MSLPFCLLDSRLNGVNEVDGGHRAIKYTRYTGWGASPDLLRATVSDGCPQVAWSDRECL